jgi:hypothetical protein
VMMGFHDLFSAQRWLSLLNIMPWGGVFPLGPSFYKYLVYLLR